MPDEYDHLRESADLSIEGVLPNGTHWDEERREYVRNEAPLSELTDLPFPSIEVYCIADCGCSGGQPSLLCVFEPDCSRCRPRQMITDIEVPAEKMSQVGTTIAHAPGLTPCGNDEYDRQVADIMQRPDDYPLSHILEAFVHNFNLDDYLDQIGLLDDRIHDLAVRLSDFVNRRTLSQSAEEELLNIISMIEPKELTQELNDISSGKE